MKKRPFSSFAFGIFALALQISSALAASDCRGFWQNCLINNLQSAGYSGIKFRGGSWDDGNFTVITPTGKKIDFYVGESRVYPSAIDAPVYIYTSIDGKSLMAITPFIEGLKSEKWRDFEGDYFVDLQKKYHRKGYSFGGAYTLTLNADASSAILESKGLEANMASNDYSVIKISKDAISGQLRHKSYSFQKATPAEINSLIQSAEAVYPSLLF